MVASFAWQTQRLRCAWLFQSVLHCCEALWTELLCVVKREELAVPLFGKDVCSNSTKDCKIERAVAKKYFVIFGTMRG